MGLLSLGGRRCRQQFVSEYASKPLEDLSLFLHKLLLLLVLDFLFGGELFAGAAPVIVVVRVFCFTRAAGTSVDVSHELGALRIVVVVFEQHLSRLLVER